MEQFFNNLEFTNDIWKLIIPLSFMIIDVITGYIQAVINKNISSSKMRVGLLHKFLIGFIIIIAYLFQFGMKSEATCNMIIIYVCIMELSSILENLQKAKINIGLFKKFFKVENLTETSETIKRNKKK